MTANEYLQALLKDTADKVDQWTDAENWTFEPDSAASTECANTETRADGTAWGDRPVRTVYQFGQMATKYTVEMARSQAILVGVNRPPPALEVLTRSSLEAASVVSWLLE